MTEQSGTGDSSIAIQRSPDQKYGLEYSADYTPIQTRALNASAGYRGGGAYATRPVLGSFALVDVPNVPDVKVYAENALVGKTNNKGKLLVPDLLPNYGNSISVDDRDVPVNTSIQVTQQRVAPAEQAGSIVVFGARELHALEGTVIVNVHGKSVTPWYGELTLQSGDSEIAESILGNGGEFYLESVPAGSYKARVIFGGGTCVFDFGAPTQTGILVKLGTLGCAIR